MALSMSRVMLLATVTVFGAVNHASFLPFAAIVWIAVAMRPYPSPQPSPRKRGEGVPDTLAPERGEGRVRGTKRAVTRLPLILIGLLALATGSTLTAWLMHQHAATGPGTLAGGIPGIHTIALALLTGRFAAELQPAVANPSGVMNVLAHVVPGPAIVWSPLACLAWMRRDTRATATLLASAAAAVWLFSARTWLRDLEVAYSAANVTLTLLAGLGVTWLVAQPIRDAKMAAALAALVLSINGAFVPERFGLPLQTARLQAFVNSVSPSINGAAWSTSVRRYASA